MSNLNLNKEDDIQITNEEDVNKVAGTSNNLNKNPTEQLVKSKRKLSGEVNDITQILEKNEKKRKKKENIPEGPIK